MYRTFSIAAKPIAVIAPYTIPSRIESNSLRNRRKTTSTASPFSASSMIGATMDVVPNSAALSEPVNCINAHAERRIQDKRPAACDHHAPNKCRAEQKLWLLLVAVQPVHERREHEHRHESKEKCSS